MTMLNRLNRLRKNACWFSNNVAQLKQHYIGQWVAIDEEKVVASSKDYKEVVAKVYSLLNSEERGIYIGKVYKTEPFLILRTS